MPLIRRIIRLLLGFGVAVSVLAGTSAIVLVVTPTPAHAAGPRPLFQLPFRCAEQWWAMTYATHDPIEKVDFIPESGTTEGRPVLADADGIAYASGSADSSGGYQIAIDHGGGWATLYLHLQAGSSTVPGTGRRVMQGEQVARVGNTGTNTSGAHLHYEQVQDAYVASDGHLVYGTIVRATFNGELATYTPDSRQLLTSHNCGVQSEAEEGRTRFADIDADGKAEIISINPDGTVYAYKNTNGLPGPPNSTYTQGGTLIAQGFTTP